MDEGARSGGISDGVVNNRHSTGCLVVKKKADGLGGGGGYSGPDIVYRRKEKKRPRLVESDSQSGSDEPLDFYRRRSGSNLVSTSSSSLKYERGNAKDSEFGRSKAVKFARDEVFPEESKRSTLDVYDFDEYDDLEDVKKRYFDTDGSGRVLVGRKQFMGRRELDTCSHRRVMMSDRRVPSHQGASGEKIRGDSFPVNGSLDIKSKLPIQALKGNFKPRSDEAIRLQGKNGVLKLMVKNKNIAGSSTTQNFEDVEGSSMSQTREVTPKKAMMHRPTNLGKKRLIDQNELEHVQVDRMEPIKTLQSKSCEDSDGKSVKKEEPTRIASNDARTRHTAKRGRSESEVASSPERFQASRMEIKIKRGGSTGSKAKFSSGAESKVKRGSGTEKQLLREKIKSILVGAGWTIDYRPRRNRDYFDAVYINPAGTAYWSIIKAYDAFQKQLEEEGAKASEDCSTTDLISDDVLSKLTRQTQKKLERELKRKKREDIDIERKRRAAKRKVVSNDSETDSTNSDSEEDKLSSFMKQRGISKQKLREFRNECGNRQTGRMEDRIENSSIPYHFTHGRKTKKIGRCTLLVRSAYKGLNSEGNGFVPFKGKRTLLSWLIDSGTVRLSEKVLYMNRRRSRVMLEGWATRDGIHCGCCSKILTVSKFEMHAASKLHQPYQNICLKSGASLLECQVDAWNSQDDALRRGMNVIDVDGDDPNDDTCGICGDGGDLICCDGCPSTFHQNCLGIEMLPPGDWHCSHCSCKFCGLIDIDISQKTERMLGELTECSLCERKYHGSCIEDMNASSTSFNNQISFCGRKCQELFEQIQKLLGVRHEIESGLSWSLIRCSDLQIDPSHRGFSQKVEWNAKLAVASQVMDECFLPITDRRSGISLIQNVLYNCRSNFNRLNYGGFCTAVLERGDEIICAASIRIHGTQLAEMPFIGTRHIYRRQGMCRRLLLAIESALRSLKVEKLIIPAISDMMDTWTTVFGFTPLEDSHKQEMKSLNMLVFPGTDMLQKRLVKPPERDILEVKGSESHKDDCGYSPTVNLTKGSDMEASPGDARASHSLPHGDLLIEKSDTPHSDHSIKESDVSFGLHESGASKNAAFLPISSQSVSSDSQALPKVSQESGNSLSQSHDKKVICPSKRRNNNVDVIKYSVENLTNVHAPQEGAKTDTHGNNAAHADAGSKLADDSIVGISDPSLLKAGPEENVQVPSTAAEMPDTETDMHGSSAAHADMGSKLVDDSIVGISDPSLSMAGPEENVQAPSTAAEMPNMETDTHGNGAAHADIGSQLADDIVGIPDPSLLMAGPEEDILALSTVTEMPESKSYAEEIVSPDVSRGNLLIGNPELDYSSTNNDVAIEFGIGAATNINDKITGVGSALKDMITSPSVIHSRLNVTNESALKDMKILDSISTLEASVSSASRIADSDVSDVPKLQMEEAETDSPAMDSTQHHKAAEISVHSEGRPTTNTSSLSEAAGFPSDGISVPVPCSGCTHESKLQALETVDHSELKPQSDSCIGEKKSNLMNNGVDGDGPTCDSHGEGSCIQMPEC